MRLLRSKLCWPVVSGAAVFSMLACPPEAGPQQGPRAAGAAPIDRQALVTRHDPVLRRFDPESPLSVGNGELAFTADVTGLQTFAAAFDDSIPLGTLSQWGWHTWPNPTGWSIDRFGFNEFESHGRKVGYADIPGDKRIPEIEWLRANPHRLHLGRMGFRLVKVDGRKAEPSDLTDVEQRLDLWNGVLVSRFRLGGQTVEVETLCHPQRDVLGVRVRSPLLKLGRIAVELRFPYGTGHVTTADWSKPEAHQTRLERPARDMALFDRRLDADSYSVAARWSPEAALQEEAKHRFLLKPGSTTETFEFVVGFGPQRLPELPSLDATRTATRQHWNRFWSEGAAIDLSESKDSRWRELERRVVLSQYLTAIQCAGRYPPQETGLTFNSWEGKFHLEMHWWHAAQFALLEPAAAAREEPRLLPGDPAAGASDRAPPGLRWRALAEDDEPERGRVAVLGRSLPGLAAAAPDLLRRADPSRAA